MSISRNAISIFLLLLLFNSSSFAMDYEARFKKDVHDCRYGLASGCFGAGYYLSEFAKPINYSKAIEYFKKACALGDRGSCELARSAYHKKQIPLHSTSEVIKYYDQACNDWAKAGFKEACANAGDAFYYGMNGVSKDLNKAYEYYKKTCFLETYLEEFNIQANRSNACYNLEKLEKKLSPYQKKHVENIFKYFKNNIINYQALHDNYYETKEDKITLTESEENNFKIVSKLYEEINYDISRLMNDPDFNQSNSVYSAYQLRKVAKNIEIKASSIDEIVLQTDIEILKNFYEALSYGIHEMAEVYVVGAALIESRLKNNTKLLASLAVAVVSKKAQYLAMPIASIAMLEIRIKEYLKIENRAIDELKNRKYSALNKIKESSLRYLLDDYIGRIPSFPVD